MKHHNHQGPPKGSRNAAKAPEDRKDSRAVVRLTQGQKLILGKLARSQGLTESALILSRLPEIGE